MENPVSKIVDTDQTPHDVASDLGLHCLPMTFHRFPGKNGLMRSTHRLASGRCMHSWKSRLFLNSTNKEPFDKN